MGVGASMSVSIVIGGRLWGMLACHHMAPRQVPYPIRMAVDVMAQVIASTVQSLAAQRPRGGRSPAPRGCARRSCAPSRSAARSARSCMRESPALRENLGCDALLVTLDGIPRAADHVRRRLGRARSPPGSRSATKRWCTCTTARNCRRRWPGQPEHERWCGVLALRFDAPRQGWIVGLRREVIQTIRWGGKPEKVIAHGPLGPRLTPRGSFAEWRETVRGRAEPWNDVAAGDRVAALDSVGRALCRPRARDRPAALAAVGRAGPRPAQPAAVAEHGHQRARARRRTRRGSTR